MNKEKERTVKGKHTEHIVAAGIRTITSLRILKQKKMDMSQLFCGSRMEAMLIASLTEHQCSNAHVHPRHVDVTQENLQPLKGVGNAEVL